ncbi:RibD family protein [Pontimicrobium sp. IMCC45349]|uniref:RibD family protein n=1 Tax=Pontimicrobium sp. IMCC45349 TaxID=3391574 RepID=UPI0039A3645C
MIISDKLWQELLILKDKSVTNTSLGWTFDGNTFSEICDTSNLDASIIGLLLKGDNDIEKLSVLSHYKLIKTPFEELSLYVKKDIDKALLDCLQNYWPLSVLSHLHNDVPHIFIHAATSLDGYLATSSGHSRWIGNEENLIHAHRLRALTDAILVGSKTVINDKPLLNVRHVEGKSPKRLILSNKCKDLSSLQKNPDCDTFLLRDSEYNYDDCTNHFDKIIAFKGTSKKEKILDLLKKCKDENISSILIEGGGSTLSAFIETNFAKVIQLHLSPMLFGDGIKAVKLPKSNLVDDTLKLKDMYMTQIGNSFMITAGIV